MGSLPSKINIESDSDNSCHLRNEVDTVRIVKNKSKSPPDSISPSLDHHNEQQSNSRICPKSRKLSLGDNNISSYSVYLKGIVDEFLLPPTISLGQVKCLNDAQPSSCCDTNTNASSSCQQSACSSHQDVLQLDQQQQQEQQSTAPCSQIPTANNSSLSSAIVSYDDILSPIYRFQRRNFNRVVKSCQLCRKNFHSVEEFNHHVVFSKSHFVNKQEELSTSIRVEEFQTVSPSPRS